jgi:hypothetical protein
MLKESLVFNRNSRLLHERRNLIKGHRNAILGVQGRDIDTVNVRHDVLHWQWNLGEISRQVIEAPHRISGQKTSATDNG